MIVVTLTKVPPALRGDLTKWCQEIQTGVYVGNVSARIRDRLWERVMKNIGKGEATLVYTINNELGYDFRTTRRDRQAVDLDGVSLMMHLSMVTASSQHGFSDAAKFHRARIMAHKNREKRSNVVVSQSLAKQPVVALDLETTGLDSTQADIIAIGAVKHATFKGVTEFERLIRIDGEVPAEVTTLTGITTGQLQQQGVPLAEALLALRDFVQEAVIVGYNIHFDEKFLNRAFQQTQQAPLTNLMRDLMPVVKTAQEFLDNYRLKTVLATYGIVNVQPHQALSDARATLALTDKLIEEGQLDI